MLLLQDMRLEKNIFRKDKKQTNFSIQKATKTIKVILYIFFFNFSPICSNLYTNNVVLKGPLKGRDFVLSEQLSEHGELNVSHIYFFSYTDCLYAIFTFMNKYKEWKLWVQSFE